MRNLLAIILRYSGFFVFVILEIISFVLIIRHNNEQQVIFFSSANFFSGKLYEERTEWMSYFRLQEINDSLAAENAALKARLLRTTLNENYTEDTLFLGTDSMSYQIRAARVINNSVNQFNNYLTINRGSKDGIKKNQGVLGLPGVVGIVKNVSGHYAQVMSVLHHQCRISAKIKRNDYFGNISWPGISPDTVLLNAIPKHIQVQVGDSVVTSGFSTIFPPDIYIGTIENVKKERGSNFYQIKVSLTNDLQSTRYVYVVDHLLRTEREQLEQAETNAE